MFSGNASIVLDTKERKCFIHEVWDSVRHSVPTKTPLFSSNKVTSRKSKKLWTKGPEWNNAAHEEKEKYPYFIHPFQQKRKNEDVRNRGDQHQEQEKVKSYEPKALNETMLHMRRKKSLTFSHTQHWTLPISTKEKKWGGEKKNHN